ncbi:hypothetical protein MRB53_038956 [Persea americana]|nr:hypothetical protein MRB53_038956 [Persea americana]
MNWQPNAAQLSQLAKFSDINNYLTYLTTHAEAETQLTSDQYQAARSAAAILLKNNIRSSWSTIQDASKTYIRSTIVLGLNDSNQLIRNYTGNVITELVKKGGVLSWPQILPDLVAAIQNSSSSPSLQEGAMGAIFKICEDNSVALDKEYQSQRPLAFLIPKLLEFTQSSSQKIRAKALSTINIFLADPIALSAKENIDKILPQIIQMTTDTDEDVRRACL